MGLMMILLGGGDHNIWLLDADTSIGQVSEQEEECDRVDRIRNLDGSYAARGPTVLTVPSEGKALVNAGSVFFRYVNKKDLHNAVQNGILEGFKITRNI